MLLNWLTHSELSGTYKQFPDCMPSFDYFPSALYLACVNLDHCLALSVFSCWLSVAQCASWGTKFFGWPPVTNRLYPDDFGHPLLCCQGMDIFMFLFLNLNHKNKINKYLKSHMMTFWQLSLFVKAHLKWFFRLLKRGRKWEKWSTNKSTEFKSTQAKIMLRSIFSCCCLFIHLKCDCWPGLDRVWPWKPTGLDDLVYIGW